VISVIVLIKGEIEIIEASISMTFYEIINITGRASFMKFCLFFTLMLFHMKRIITLLLI
jgi:hypothetical protein